MISAISAGPRTRHLQAYVAPALATCVGATLVGVMLVAHRWQIAAVLAALPLGAFAFGKARAVYAWVLCPVVFATFFYGKAFAQIRVGPIFALDAALVVVAVLTLPALVRALGARPAATAVLGLLIADGLLHVYEAGATRVVLRQSVIVVYATWVFVGIAVARSGILDRFMTWTYWGGVAATVFLFRGDRHDVAHDLYVSFGILLLVLYPQAARYRRLAYVIVFAQLAILGLGLVRAIWIALPATLLVVALLFGNVGRYRAQLARVAAIAAVMVVGVVVAEPALVAKLGSQASSIVSYSGTSSSDNNAKWRLTNWHYAISEIEKHPFTGVGFGAAEVPPSVCGTGCNVAVVNDPTVLAGADLHNSFLAIGLRLGIPGLMLLVVFEALILFRARKLYRSAGVGQWLVACHIAIGFAALTSVVLEGPYMGIFFWFFGGLALAYRPEPVPEAA